MNPFIERYFLEPGREFFQKLLQFLPNLFSFLIIIAVGIIIANILRLLCVRFLKIVQFDRGCERVGVDQMLKKGGLRDMPSHLTGRVVYWILISIFLIMALNSLRVPSVEQLMTRFLLYLPNVFVAVFVAVMGYLVGNFLGRAALIAAVNAGIPFSRPIGQAVKAGIFVLALTIAMEQLGIGRSTITVAFAILFGGVVLALAIAFGLGGRDMARDYLERRLSGPAEKKENGDDISHI